MSLARRPTRSGSRRRDDRPEPPPTVAGRVPPHDLDAEAAVLSACFLDAGALDVVLAALKSEHFYSDANGRIFEAMGELHAANTPVDLVSVASYLRDRERLAQIGGPTYLAQLADATPAVAHVDAHAKVVREKWRVRSLIATCQRVAAEGYGDIGEPQAFIDGAEQDIYNLAHAEGQRSDMLPINTLLRDRFSALTKAAEQGDGAVNGILTRYTRLDGQLAGLHPGELIIMAGRPGMGKTAAAMCLGVNVAAPRTATIPDVARPGKYKDVEAPGYGVCVFSLEMPKEQLADRMICSEARVDLNKLRKMHLQPEDWRHMTEAASWLSSLPLWVDDTSAISLLELRAKVRRRQAEYNRPATDDQPERKVGLVIVDYLQLMSAPDSIESREQQISYLSRGLKAMAKELGVAVIALSQLNRAVETRSTKDKRPQISDLRESGALEQDSDVIILLYRHEYYFPDDGKTRGIAEWDVAKQRNGATGKVMMKFTGYCSRFDELAASEYPSDVDE